MLDLEAQRLENIRRNTEMLLQMGLPADALVTPAGSAPSQSATESSVSAKKSRSSIAGKKRKAETDEADYSDNAESGDDDDGYEKSKKKPAKLSKRPSMPGARRSSRNAAKADINYSEDGGSMVKHSAVPKLVSKAAQKRANEEDEVDGELPRHKLGQRKHNPKQFGHIPGIPVGKVWELRMHCSTDAVHAPVVAGISGNKDVGAWSVALSGGYEDDVDLGYAFTFTGAGGRDLKGTKQNPKNLRTAPQSKDQDWTENNLNAALKKSSETGKPVRVIRGFKGHSKFAPEEGYRYDGLYTVTRAWMEQGLNKGGFMVCKYAFVRLSGQPPIPERGENNPRASRSRSETTDVSSEQEDETTADEGVSTENADDADTKEDEEFA